MAIKGILFDKDGVLVDFQRTYAPSTREIITLLSGKNGNLAREMASAVDFDLPKVCFNPGSIVIAGTARDIADAWHPHLPDLSIDKLVAKVENLYDDLTVKHVSAFGDVASSLSRLQVMGMLLGVATNDTEESAHRHLTAIGQEKAFDFIAGYDSGYGAKPEPGMILAFSDCIRANPAEVIMIGDSLHDLHAGKSAGAVCVGLTTGLADHGTLSPTADHVLSSLSELPDLVVKLNAADA